MTTQNLNLGMLEKIMSRISTPEGLEATAQQLSVVSPPDVNALAQQAGSMQSLEDRIRQRIDPGVPQTPGVDASAVGGLGQALLQQAQPQATPTQMPPMQLPPAQVPGQFVMQSPTPTPVPQMTLAQALRGR